jgi:hypothetical protein
MRGECTLLLLKFLMVRVSVGNRIRTVTVLIGIIVAPVAGRTDDTGRIQQFRRI